MEKITSLFARSIVLVQGIGKKGFFHLLSANILIQGAGFASQILVAWILTPSDIGAIKLLQSYANIASIIASFGFNSSVLKLCSESRSFPERKYLYAIAVKYTIMTSIATFVLFIIASRLGAFSSDSSLFPYFTIYGFIIIAIALNNIQSAYLQALKEIPLMSKIQASAKIATMVLIICMTYYFKLNGYFAAILIGSYITVCMFLFGIRSLHIESTIEISTAGFHLHWFYAKYSFLSNLAYQIFLVVDVILVNRLLTDKMLIGFYSFALILIVPFEVLRGTVQQVVTPYFSEKANHQREFYRVFYKYHRLLKLFSVVITALAIIVVPILIRFVFRGKYEASVEYFQVLIIAWLVRCFYSLKSIGLWGLGRFELNFYIVAVTLIPAFVITFLFIKNYGIVGAAYGVVANEILTFILTEFFFRKNKYSTVRIDNDQISRS
jgi:O-antigen/teichoic acid export membrane protein